jgi:Protein of unknown function (DUF3788)
MALSIFDDKSKPPKDAELATALKDTFLFWNELKKLIALRFKPLSTEWGFTSTTTGWGMRLKNKDRTILYMIPRAGHFLASFALFEKAVKAAHEDDLPVSVLRINDNAKKYAEGRGVRIEVRNGRDVRNVEKLATIKMST